MTRFNRKSFLAPPPAMGRRGRAKGIALSLALSMGMIGTAVPASHAQDAGPVDSGAGTITAPVNNSLANPTGGGAPVAGPSNTTNPRPGQFDGFDFGHVVERMEGSVSPLQKEMESSFRVFIDKVVEAEQLMDEGNVKDAVQGVVSAVQGVIQVRDRVLNPMWEGQDFLNTQIGRVRTRLAKAVEASNKGNQVKLDKRTEQMLDKLAIRIANEKDALRKKRLTAHYRTARNIAQIRSMAVQLSPDQRKLWMNVLRVLEEASLAHEQVTLGTELLFAQFDATAGNLQEYVTLLETINGASELIGVVRGKNGQGTGMAGFAKSMGELQKRLAGFNTTVERVLETNMTELEAQIDQLQIEQEDDGVGVNSPDEDDELQARIRKLTGAPNATKQGDK